MAEKYQITLKGEIVELTEEEARQLISEICDKFGLIGTVLNRADVEDFVGEPISDDVWVSLNDEIADDVVRLMESL